MGDNIEIPDDLPIIENTIRNIQALVHAHPEATETLNILIEIRRITNQDNNLRYISVMRQLVNLVLKFPLRLIDAIELCITHMLHRMNSNLRNTKYISNVHFYEELQMCKKLYELTIFFMLTRFQFRLQMSSIFSIDVIKMLEDSIVQSTMDSVMELLARQTSPFNDDQRRLIFERIRQLQNEDIRQLWSTRSSIQSKFYQTIPVFSSMLRVPDRFRMIVTRSNNNIR